jgi:hypothetical protein
MCGGLEAPFRDAPACAVERGWEHRAHACAASLRSASMASSPRPAVPSGAGSPVDEREHDEAMLTRPPARPWRTTAEAATRLFTRASSGTSERTAGGPHVRRRRREYCHQPRDDPGDRDAGVEESKQRKPSGGKIAQSGSSPSRAGTRGRHTATTTTGRRHRRTGAPRPRRRSEPDGDLQQRQDADERSIQATPARVPRSKYGSSAG